MKPFDVVSFFASHVVAALVYGLTFLAVPGLLAGVLLVVVLVGCFITGDAGGPTRKVSSSQPWAPTRCTACWAPTGLPPRKCPPSPSPATVFDPEFTQGRSRGWPEARLENRAPKAHNCAHYENKEKRTG